jgi:hypothetical protein
MHHQMHMGQCAWMPQAPSPSSCQLHTCPIPQSAPQPGHLSLSMSPTGGAGGQSQLPPPPAGREARSVQ